MGIISAVFTRKPREIARLQANAECGMADRKPKEYIRKNLGLTNIDEKTVSRHG
jgi:hypothetical protein